MKLIKGSNLTNTQVEIIKAVNDTINYDTLKKIMRRTFKESPYAVTRVENVGECRKTSDMSCKRKCHKGHQSDQLKESSGEISLWNYK